MKNIVILILVLLCIGLGVAWYYQFAQASEKQESDLLAIQSLSNTLSAARSKLDEQYKVNESLRTNLVGKGEELEKFNQRVSSLTENLATAEAQAKAQIERSQAEIAKRDAKITELESQRDDLTKRMTVLNTSITSLENQISETQRKLEASEGDREFLLGELKRMQAEKADLERQFQDLAVLREQVKKLREELSISKRLEWVRRGLYGSSTLKGAERLQVGFQEEPSSPPSFPIDVELKRNSDAGAPPQQPPPPEPSAAPDPSSPQ